MPFITTQRGFIPVSIAEILYWLPQADVMLVYRFVATSVLYASAVTWSADASSFEKGLKASAVPRTCLEVLNLLLLASQQQQQTLMHLPPLLGPYHVNDGSASKRLSCIRMSLHCRHSLALPWL